MNYVDVILPVPLEGMFTYAVPAVLQDRIQVGIRVRVPFGRTKTYLAIVARLHNEEPQGYEVKTVTGVIDNAPVLLPQQLKLWQWMSHYYMCPIGEVMKAALPAGLKKEDGQEEGKTTRRKKPRLEMGGEPHPDLIQKLTEPQADALNQLKMQWLKHRVVLLHGVTGSGKTEIYIHLIQQAIDRHEQVLYLLPEIALTVQMMDRLRRVFGNRLGIYHSKYSDAQRQELWQKQLSANPYDIILGVRSSVFLPFRHLGLVIVDEEHETSYKQQEPMPRYHARDVAVMLSAPTILPRLGEAIHADDVEQKIIDYYKTSSPDLYALLSEYSKTMRGNQTEAESAMWELLRRKQLDVKFRRQHIIGDFIVDFVCLNKKLVVEVDGGYHNHQEQKEVDRLRTQMLSDMGYRVVRFTNEEILSNPDNVINAIRMSLEQQVSSTLGAPKASPSWGRLEGASVLLGTATPSMESWFNAMPPSLGEGSGGGPRKYGLVELTERYKGMELPDIQVVDVKTLIHRKEMKGPFSPILLARIREALEQGEQVILFQNRRGFAPMVECRQCGWVPRCQQCDVSLTVHRSLAPLLSPQLGGRPGAPTANMSEGQKASPSWGRLVRAVCHYCGAVYSVPAECPCCGSKELQAWGYGTEKIEDEIRDIFPEASVARMDLDTTRSRHAYEDIIRDFSEGRTNILIGTQMVSKGLDFDRVSVVGILNADTMLNQPDFRAYEHAFMMMAQVSGRAGRKKKRGLVILQTRQPELPVIRQVVTNDWPAFYDELLQERRDFRYPPYYRLIDIYLKHKDDRVVSTAATTLATQLRQWFGTRLLGPDKPAVARVRQQNIRKMVLKLENGIDGRRVREYLRLAEKQLMADKRYASLLIYYDVDPL